MNNFYMILAIFGAVFIVIIILVLITYGVTVAVDEIKKSIVEDYKKIILDQEKINCEIVTIHANNHGLANKLIEIQELLEELREKK